jgi:hypothetical protein
MAADVSTEEAFRLTRVMTFKKRRSRSAARRRQIGDLR